MNWGPINELANKVNAMELTAVELVDRALAKIDETTEYNVVLATTTERAKERALLVDSIVKKGKNAGRLAGVPFIAKDNFLAFGAPTTAASHILEPFIAPYQATAIEKLEAEGAILVAKANLDSFAHGSSTENSAFGPTLNPHDKERVPGGSSGGSAASVALGLVPFALGTDTGGSIRLPASYCGVVGLKPTYGLVSRYGVVAMGSSVDVIGPIASSVKDVGLILDIMAGRDKYDSTTIDRKTIDYSKVTNNIKGKKFGVIKEYFSDGLDIGVNKKIVRAIKIIKDRGGEILEVNLPSINLALACYYIIVPAEVSSNLSRYDGQRYGLSIKNSINLDESYGLTRKQGFEAENKRRIMVGTYVLSSGYYDDYYKKAQTVRTKLINEFNTSFQKVDFLLGPTAPTTAFKLGQNTKDPLHMYLTDIMTVAANLVGIPSISIPCGNINKLPVGLQIMAPQCQDDQLISISKIIEEII